MDVIAEFYQTLRYAHRMWGQYRRFFTGYAFTSGTPSFEEFTGYSIPKKITPGSIRNLNKAIKKARIAGEKAYRKEKKKITEERYKIIVDTFLDEFDMYSDMVNGANHFAKLGADSLKADVHIAVQTAITRKGIEYTAEGIQRFMEKYGRKLQQFAMAVIDTSAGGFNTNTRWFISDSEGEVGRARFRQMSEDLLIYLGIAGEPVFVSLGV